LGQKDEPNDELTEGGPSMSLVNYTLYLGQACGGIALACASLIWLRLSGRSNLGKKPPVRPAVCRSRKLQRTETRCRILVVPDGAGLGLAIDEAMLARRRVDLNG
jgi:hypothetical protein